MRAGDEVCCGDVKIGKVVAIDLSARTVDILLRASKTEIQHPTAVFVDGRGPNQQAMAGSLLRLGDWVNAHGLDAPGPHRAARDLLLRRPPRFQAGVELASGPQRIATALDQSVLAIQGPPGSGKTYTGARMICALLREGKKVGVVATAPQGHPAPPI